MDPKNGDISLPVDFIRTVAIILVILLHASAETSLNVDFMSAAGVQLVEPKHLRGYSPHMRSPLCHVDRRIAAATEQMQRATEGLLHEAMASHRYTLHFLGYCLLYVGFPC